MGVWFEKIQNRIIYPLQRPPGCEGIQLVEKLNISKCFIQSPGTVRLEFFIALCAYHEWYRKALDVNPSFLNANLDEEINIEQSKEF